MNIKKWRMERIKRKIKKYNRIIKEVNLSNGALKIATYDFDFVKKLKDPTFLLKINDRDFRIGSHTWKKEFDYWIITITFLEDWSGKGR